MDDQNAMVAGRPAESKLLHAVLTDRILACAIEVHRTLGPGLLESAYESCMAREFAWASIAFARQLELPVVYKGEPVDAGFRMDFVVEDAVVVEVKAVETVLPVHEAQLLTYLKLSGKRVGLLINFNVTLLKNGITRRIL